MFSQNDILFCASVSVRWHTLKALSVMLHDAALDSSRPMAAVVSLSYMFVYLTRQYYIAQCQDLN